MRIAEDAATLSLLTGGRFDLGVGIGYRELEFREFGRAAHASQEPDGGGGGDHPARPGPASRIAFAGKRFNVGDVRVHPVPEHPPKLYLGGMVEPAIDRAARIADGFLSTGGIGQDVYVNAWPGTAARPSDGVIIAGHWAIISDDPEREAAIVGPARALPDRTSTSNGAHSARRTRRPAFRMPRPRSRRASISSGMRIPPSSSSAELLEQYPQIRDVHFWAQLPGEPVASGQRRIEYMARHVLPRRARAL